MKIAVIGAGAMGSVFLYLLVATIGAKADFGHVHIQIPALMRISRTVQWFREAAHQDSTGLQRIIDESALSSIYLAAFARWLFDDTGYGNKGKAFLETALRRWLGSGYVLRKQSTASGRTPISPTCPTSSSKRASR